MLHEKTIFFAGSSPIYTMKQGVEANSIIQEGVLQQETGRGKGSCSPTLWAAHLLFILVIACDQQRVRWPVPLGTYLAANTSSYANGLTTLIPE